MLSHMATTTQVPLKAVDLAELQGHFIVCGLDELAFRAAEELQKLGEQAVVIVSSASGKFAHQLISLGVPLVHGNYREESALVAAGLLRARALIIAESDDVGNLHAALAAHELMPELRIVLRIFNQELGRRVQTLLRDCEVLSSSGIAAPSFVSAALQAEFEQRIEAAGRELIVRHGAWDGPGVLLPIARQEDDGSITLFPESGDNVLCLADPNVAQLSLRAVVKRRRRLLPSSIVAAGHLITSLADRRVRTLILMVTALVVASMIVFHWFWNLSLLDAVYFTITTITTIGYGDITLISAPWYLKTYGIVLELLGAAIMAIFFAVITDTLVGARLRQALGGVYRDLDDHVVVCGLGNMGHRVVEQIHAQGVDVVVMELSESAKALTAIRRLGVPVLVGDARESVNLQSLRVDTARSLVVATQDDMTNLEIALAARAINPDLKVVLQLHDPDLAARLQRALRVGISRSLAGLAAPAFVSAALGHRVVSAVPVGERMLVIAVSTVAAHAESVGQTIKWLQDGPYGRVLMLRRGGSQIWVPRLDMVLEAGDELVLVATRKGLDGVLKLTEVVA